MEASLLGGILLGLGLVILIVTNVIKKIVGKIAFVVIILGLICAFVGRNNHSTLIIGLGTLIIGIVLKIGVGLTSTAIRFFGILFILGGVYLLVPLLG